MSEDEQNQIGPSEFLHFIGIDIVRSSGRNTSSYEQALKSEHLKKILKHCGKYNEALKNDYYIKDMGDGVFIGFPKDIEAPIELALQIHENMERANTDGVEDFHVRIGLHSYPIYRVIGFAFKTEIRGWGISGVQRVMGFGDENHILASHWIAEQLLDLNRRRYSPIVDHPLGRRLDKNGKVFSLYNIYGKDFGNPSDPTAPPVEKIDHLEYYKSLITEMISFEDVKLPYIELWSSGSQGIKQNQLDCYLSDQSFVPENLLSAHIRQLNDWLALDRRVGNRRVARLHHIDEKDGRLRLYFQETAYRYSLATNFFLDVKFRNLPILRDILAGKKLPELDSTENRCSNHLGVNCIIETADDPPIIFLQKRSSEVAVFWNVYGASVGAGLGWESGYLETGKKSAPSPFQELLVEIIDELGIMPEEIEILRMMAICRELESGGKPTSFFVAKTELKFGEIVRRFNEDNPSGKWETEYLRSIIVEKHDELRRSVSGGFLDGIEVSGSARANLYYYLIWKNTRGPQLS